MARNIPAGGRQENWRLQEMSLEEQATSNSCITQIFDKNSITTIALLYFLDHDKFLITRFQVSRCRR